MRLLLHGYVELQLPDGEALMLERDELIRACAMELGAVHRFKIEDLDPVSTVALHGAEHRVTRTHVLVIDEDVAPRITAEDHPSIDRVLSTRLSALQKQAHQQAPGKGN